VSHLAFSLSFSNKRFIQGGSLRCRVVGIIGVPRRGPRRYPPSRGQGPYFLSSRDSKKRLTLGGTTYRRRRIHRTTIDVMHTKCISGRPGKVSAVSELRNRLLISSGPGCRRDIFHWNPHGHIGGHYPRFVYVLEVGCYSADYLISLQHLRVHKPSTKRSYSLPASPMLPRSLCCTTSCLCSHSWAPMYSIAMTIIASVSSKR
jgi:hypothetical protein